MRSVAALLILAALLLACSKPAIDPTAAGITKGVVVCWHERAANDSKKSKLRDAFGAQLRSAGYTLQSKGCDLRMHWEPRTATRKGIHVYRSATLSLTDVQKKPIDSIQFEIERNHILVSEPERLATLFVNAMNASPKLADYAASKTKGAGDVDAEDAPAEDPVPEPEKPETK